MPQCNGRLLIQMPFRRSERQNLHFFILFYLLSHILTEKATNLTENPQKDPIEDRSVPYYNMVSAVTKERFLYEYSGTQRQPEGQKLRHITNRTLLGAAVSGANL
jgi:hypothetical protein